MTSIADRLAGPSAPAASAAPASAAETAAAASAAAPVVASASAVAAAPAATAAPATTAAPAITFPAVGERELRLDLFRGLALWLIFIDHLPPNLLTWFTIRNYGFSDATEIFIFISGYTAAFVYGRAMQDAGFIVATARILRRVWQIYVAHVFLFTIFLAEISYVATSFENPLYTEEMGIMDFLKQPDVTIVQALILRFRPVNMDVLPLYIVLMLFLPLILWLMRWRPDVTLGLSVVLYALTWELDLYLTAYPNGFWAFNPFAWQLLFVFGAWCALGGAQRMSRIINSPITLGLCVAYLVAAFFVTLTWYIPQLGHLMPRRIEQWMYPIDKTDLDVLRFAHFLALAALTVHYLRKDWPLLKSPWLRPLIVCGQHSLEIFCLGVFLAFAGHFVLAEVSGGAMMHAVISLCGILIMWGVASLISWYKREADKGAARKGARSNADLAGGG
ncbi:OpgC domain-containing protein [Bradyrhizobium oligotrophicum]|uniref:OpgC domain-containing protein n=1 Tax=Bradyrhizobium oligotrophicum TaxID=44255 RepID=UPI003EBF3C29